MTTSVRQFMCLTDNFGVLVHDSETGATATIDAPDARPILDALGDWVLTDALITHHHSDHVQGVPELKAKFPDLAVYGPAKEAARIPFLTTAVKEGERVRIGASEAIVLDTPGHTLGHVIYYFEKDQVVFCGDTLFSLGCGRPFEAPYAVFWSSLAKIAALPPETQVYCGHEYTKANGAFAATVEPNNAALKRRLEEVSRLRQAGLPTLPTTIAGELATNPFLRVEEPSVQAAVGLPGAAPAVVFGELRSRKDRF